MGENSEYMEIDLMKNTQSTRDSSNGEESFRNAVDAASNAASNIGGEVRKGVQEVGSAVRDASSQAARQLTESGSVALQTVTEKAREATEQLHNVVKKSPFVSLGIAFGAGILMAGLLRRR